MCETNLGGIICVAEHGFAKKHASNRYAIQSAYQFRFAILFAPHLYGMSEAHLMECAISEKHIVIDPGAACVGTGSRALAHHLFKSLIESDPIIFFAQRFLQAA